jgi:apolipoprotein N-acyltransferase
MTLAVAATPARVVAFPRRRSSWAAMGLAVAALITMITYGALRLAAPAPGGEQIAVRIVQPDFREQANYSQARFEAMLETYAVLTAQPSALDRPPEIILWPEGALPSSLNDLLSPAGPARQAIFDALFSYRAEDVDAMAKFFIDGLGLTMVQKRKDGSVDLSDGTINIAILPLAAIRAVERDSNI